MDTKHRRTTTVAASVVAVTLVLLGCSSGGPTADESTSSTVASADVGEVSMTTTGGFAGIDRVVVVQPDGTILGADGPDSDPQPTGETMGSGDLAELHRLVGSAEFAALEDSYVPDGLCCDQFHYRVDAVVDGATISSATADGIDAPEVLDQVVDLLGSLDG